MLLIFESLAIEAKAVSSLAAIEVRSAIRRRQRFGDLSDVNANSAIAALSAELNLLREVPVLPTIIELASGIIDRHQLRSLDAVQLATATFVRDAIGDSNQFKQFQFVSSDHDLLHAAVMEGLGTWNPTP